MQTDPVWQAIEKACDVSLPLAYKNYLANYPPKLSSALYFSDSPDQGGPKDFEFLDDPEGIIELNLNEREFWPEAAYAHVSLPESYFFIGHNGGGNLFAIDTTRSDACPVFEFDHEEEAWLQRAESLEEFAELLLSGLNKDAP